MSELTDLEIIKRIAEIEGFGFTLANNTIQAKPFTVTDTFDCAHMGFTFNPLTDDGLCFRLMFKWNINCFSGAMFKDDTPTAVYIAQSPDGDDVIDESPNKAILLAIIEASK